MLGRPISKYNYNLQLFVYACKYMLHNIHLNNDVTGSFRLPY